MRCKRLSAGKYLYRGVLCQCLGYFEPEHHIVWEGGQPCNINGEITNSGGDYHARSLKELKTIIDEEIDEDYETRKYL